MHVTFSPTNGKKKKTEVKLFSGLCALTLEVKIRTTEGRECSGSECNSAGVVMWVHHVTGQKTKSKISPYEKKMQKLLFQVNLFTASMLISVAFHTTHSVTATKTPVLSPSLKLAMLTLKIKHQCW